MEHDSASLLFTLATDNLTTPTPAGDEGPGCYLAFTTWGVGADETPAIDEAAAMWPWPPPILGQPACSGKYVAKSNHQPYSPRSGQI